MPQSRSAYGALPNPPPLPQQQNPIAPRPSQKSELDKGKDIIEIWKMPAYFGLSAVQKLGETPDTHRAPRVRKSSRRAFALLPQRRRRYIYIYIYFFSTSDVSPVRPRRAHKRALSLGGEFLIIIISQRRPFTTLRIYGPRWNWHVRGIFRPMSGKTPSKGGGVQSCDKLRRTDARSLLGDRRLAGCDRRACQEGEGKEDEKARSPKVYREADDPPPGCFRIA